MAPWRSGLAARLGLFLIVGVLLLAGSASSAWAHGGESFLTAAPAASIPTVVLPAASAVPPAVAAPTVVPVSAPAPDVGRSLAFLVLAAFVALRVAPRRVAAGLLVALLAFITFEIGVHAVHHLGDAHAAAQCQVATVAPQVEATSVMPVTCTPIIEATADGVVAASTLAVVLRFVRPAHERAPPA